MGKLTSIPKAPPKQVRPAARKKDIDTAQVIMLYTQGWTQADIAREIGVKPDRIHRVLLREGMLESSKDKDKLVNDLRDSKIILSLAHMTKDKAEAASFGTLADSASRLMTQKNQQKSEEYQVLTLHSLQALEARISQLDKIAQESVVDLIPNSGTPVQYIPEFTPGTFPTAGKELDPAIANPLESNGKNPAPVPPEGGGCAPAGDIITYPPVPANRNPDEDKSAESLGKMENDHVAENA